MALPGTKLFVGGIPAANATPESLAELFEAQGAALLEVVVLPPKGTSPQTRCAFVRVQDEIASYLCETLNGMMFEGHAAPLVVRLADDSNGGKGAGRAPLPRPKTTPSSAAANGYAAQAGPPGSLKEQAVAEGRFLEAAEYKEQELATQRETREAKLRRLHRQLHVAAVQEHFVEAAAVYDAMNHLDPQAAAAAIATAIAAAQAAGDAGSQTGAIPPPPTTQPPKGAGQAAAAARAFYANGVAPSTEGALKDYVGHIITFNQERRYGFIHCPDLGRDAFLSDSQVGGFQQGSWVVFNVTYNPKGQPQAQNLREPDADATGADDASVPAAKRSRPS